MDTFQLRIALEYLGDYVVIPNIGMQMKIRNAEWNTFLL